MTPGIALFYGGMAGRQNVLIMMVTSFAAFAVVPVVYVLWGWSASYARDDIAGMVCNPLQAFGLSGQIADSAGNNVGAARFTAAQRLQRTSCRN
ncbi:MULTISPECIES: hypothetical protein [Corynebacterium]|nr:hypothetical protein [Corynebacterium hadale]WKC60804.1 Ammonia channel precursor [Corynebacterium hadale]